MVAGQDLSEEIRRRLATLAPVTLRADVSALPPSERAALEKLVEAARVMDGIFFRQVWAGNEPLLARLGRDDAPDIGLRRAFFAVMAGPWDRVDDDHPVLVDTPKPPGAGFYPEDLTREELEAYLTAHPDQAPALRDTFTLVRREGDRLVAVPYADAYRDLLERAALLLEEAAALTAEPSLARFLRARAAAFHSNDYVASDMEWMDLDGPIDVVIGPYEVYEDRLSGYKAAFEAYVTLVDGEESELLGRVSEHLDELEAALPLAPELRGPPRGGSSPIKVVNVIATGGEARPGIQTTAFNLPNDERVREAKGSKKVMLKNVAHAKFQTCWTPIASAVLTNAMLRRVTFDAYFTEVLLHEMSHGVGPGTLLGPDGSTTTVSRELKELYPTIEECKADVLGVFLMQHLLDRGGVLDPALQDALYPTYLGGMFRSVRFGISEAHGGGVIIQWNWMLERGGFRATADGRFEVDEAALRPALRDLATELLRLQATGDYEATRSFVDHYRVMTPAMSAALDRVEHVPVDIRPSYELV
jgi:hypothetical protein